MLVSLWILPQQIRGKMVKRKVFVPNLTSVYKNRNWMENRNSRPEMHRLNQVVGSCSIVSLADESIREKNSFWLNENMIMGSIAQRPFYSVLACVGTWLPDRVFQIISSLKTFRVWFEIVKCYINRRIFVSTQRSFIPSTVSRTHCTRRVCQG